MVFQRRLIVEYWRKPVEKFLKKGDTLKGTFRFEKMSGSFKKGETLRFADYSWWMRKCGMTIFIFLYNTKVDNSVTYRK